jgi:hypothetical protein
MIDEEINDLIKSNFELSMRLAGHRTDGQISYLFGRQLYRAKFEMIHG